MGGITNQRETIIIWDKNTSKPLYNAILWCDGRTKSTVKNILKNYDQNYLKNETGLPISTYFSALKIKWLIDNVPSVKEAIENGNAMFGTVDTWLVYKLTNGKSYVTDSSNASRTMLYSINSNNWSDDLLKFFNIPKSLNLPKILPSSADFGCINSIEKLKNIKITGILGDQQAALVGQQCLEKGMLKITYGSGCFMLQNTGNKKIISKNGLVTTVAYQKSDGNIVYALEGSIAVAGLFCPYWDTSARGIICGLTSFSNKNHICRASLESVAWQVRDVLEAMKNDGQECCMLKADGGMTNSELLMQIQADILKIPISIPKMKESTALGVAVAAGSFMNIWKAKGWKLFNTKTMSESSGSSNGEECSSDESSGDSAYIESENDVLQFKNVKPNVDQGYDY